MKTTLLCMAAMVVGQSVTLHGEPIGAGWGHRMKVHLNTTATGANVTSDVAKYPVAVTLSGDDFDFSQAQSDGADLRFTDENDNLLPHELEFFSAADRQAAAWVLLPLVKGNSREQFIYLYWGNASAASASNPQAVFATADGWVGVYHLSDQTGSQTDGFKDATVNAAHATGRNFPTGQSVAGRIGRCPQFKHAEARQIRIDNDKKSLFDLTDSLTFSIWCNAAGYPDQYITMFAKGDNSWRVQMFGEPGWHNGKCVPEMCVEQDGDACLFYNMSGYYDNYQSYPDSYPDGWNLVPNAWHQLTVVHHYPTVSLYVNTNVVSTTDYSGHWTSGSEPVGIGCQTQFDLNRTWDGLLDEARVLRVPKDAAWVKLDYESQKPGQKFTTFGEAEAVTSAIGLERALKLSRGAGLQKVEIYGVDGRLISTLNYRQWLETQRHSKTRALSSGVFVYRFFFSDRVATSTRARMRTFDRPE
jgi:hypothetical protein